MSTARPKTGIETDAEEPDTDFEASTTKPAADDCDALEQEPEEQSQPLRSRHSRRVRPMIVALVVLAIGVFGVAGWGLINANRSASQARAELAEIQRAADSREHAEQIALDYAQGAAEMDYKDLPSWKKRLTANTSPELAERLEEAAASMEEIFVPLEWISTATPIAATVRTADDGVYVVNAFVSVMTKNKQATNGIQSTATYSVTIDEQDNWVITDVGGVESALKQQK